jgi:serine/threonine protein kinase
LKSIKSIPDVVHGDLKPENVLIFEDKDGDITAQVSDFGYSSFKTSDQEYITLASSWPWTAPEIELDSETTLAYAKAADVFSFGMLCIWILFVGSTHEAAASDVVNTSFERRLFELKHRDQLVDFAETQIRSLPFIDPDLRAALNDIFTSTLSCAPEERDLTEKKVESAFRCKRYGTILASKVS